MKNLDKYLTLLGEEVDGLLLTSRYSRHYGAEFDIAEAVAIVTKAGCRYFTDTGSSCGFPATWLPGCWPAAPRCRS